MGRAARDLQLSGVFAAAVTSPRKGTREIDFCAPLDLIDFLTGAGMNGVALLGSTGEFVHYTFGDRERLVYLANKRTKIPLIVGVTHSTFQGTVELATEATGAGADALLVMPPYFFRYEPAEIETFYLELAREIGGTVPILLYNIPQFTSPIGFDIVARLLATGLFAGIKDSSGDWPYFERLISLRRQNKFALICGSDTIALRALTEGADALISGCACAIPEVLAGLYKCVRAGKTGQAQECNRCLEEFIEKITRFPVPVGIKRALELRGQTAGPPAIPLSAETKAALGEFAVWFKAWLPAVKEAARA